MWITPPIEFVSRKVRSFSRRVHEPPEQLGQQRLGMTNKQVERAGHPDGNGVILVWKRQTNRGRGADTPDPMTGR